MSGRIFLTGGTGYVGRRIAERLMEGGYQVAALVRPGSSRRLPDGAQPVVGGLLEMEGLLASAAPLIGVIHCAMEYGDDGEENWDADRAAVDAGLRRGVPFVYTSSLFDAPEADGTVFAEKLMDGVATRLRHEHMVMAAGQDAAIVRLGFVWGGSGKNLWKALADAPGGRGTGVAGQPAAWPLVHVDDVADLYLRVLTTGATGIFHATDGEAHDPHRLATALRGRLRAPGGLFTGLWRRRILAVPDRGRALGWTPRVFEADAG